METTDGKDGILTRENGGIWGLHEDKFDVDNPTSLFKNETAIVNCIASATSEKEEELEVELEVSEATDFAKPLGSGLIAALYLYHRLEINGTGSIPEGIEEQAQFWKTYYHSGTLTKEDFRQRVYILEKKGM